MGYTQGAGFHVYGPGLDRGVRTIALHRDGNLSTQDLRYRDLVGKKLQEPLHFAFFQIMPTNVYDAISRAVKIFAALGGIAVVALLLVLFLGK